MSDTTNACFIDRAMCFIISWNKLRSLANSSSSLIWTWKSLDSIINLHHEAFRRSHMQHILVYKGDVSRPWHLDQKNILTSEKKSKFVVSSKSKWVLARSYLLWDFTIFFIFLPACTFSFSFKCTLIYLLIQMKQEILYI